MRKQYGSILVLMFILIMVISACGNKPSEGLLGSGGVGDNSVSTGTNDGPPTSNDSQDEQDGEHEGNDDNAAEDNEEEDTNNSVDNDVTPADQSEAANTESKQIDIEVYYSDSDLTEMLSRTVAINYQSDISKYTEAYKALQNAPDADAIALWTHIELLAVSFDNGELTIDVHLHDEGRLGSTGESMAIQAFKQTLFQFEEVTAIHLLVDGGQVDTLMGHVELEYPMVE